MRFIEIDGKRYDVPGCWACPCYSEGNDYDRYEECRHPVGAVCAWCGGRDGKGEEVYGHSCPLRTKPELAEDGVVDPSKAGDVYLDPPGSNEEREIVIPEWAHTRLSEKEALGYMLAFSIPMLLEDISKMDSETKERTIKNLEEMLRMAQMKPEERPLCTMNQEEAIKRGIKACTMKGGKGIRYTEIDGKRYEMDQCWDCPFVFFDGLIPVCNHPSRPSKVTDDNVIPEDCPLRSDDLLPCPFCGADLEDKEAKE